MMPDDKALIKNALKEHAGSCMSKAFEYNKVGASDLAKPWAQKGKRATELIKEFE